MAIRPELPGDEAAIFELTRRAFASAPHSSGTEQFIVAALRRARALSVSLVAESGGEIVGHVAFSRVALSDCPSGWLGLGPISVAPERQGEGIGARLVRSGLKAIRELGARGCVLLGDPAFYGRFGFRSFEGLELEGAPAEYTLALPFGAEAPNGRLAFHEAFEARA